MEEKQEFRREMNLLDSAFLVVGSVVGTGIFMTTGFVIGFVKSPWLVMLVWALGGVITLTGALSFGELAAMYPRAGGQRGLWGLVGVPLRLDVFLGHRMRGDRRSGRWLRRILWLLFPGGF